jgi:hypothetical protein
MWKNNWKQEQEKHCKDLRKIIEYWEKKKNEYMERKTK